MKHNNIRMYDIFLKEVKKLKLTKMPILDIFGGKCVLNKPLTLAVVLLDGRYPMSGKFSLNTECTEKITVLAGRCKLTGDIDLDMEAGDAYEIRPGIKYGFEGKAVCLDEISPLWKGAQNSYVE